MSRSRYACTNAGRWSACFVMKSNHPGELKARLERAKRGLFDEETEDEDEDEGDDDE